MKQASAESPYRAMKRLYKNYVRMCRRRNVFWELTIEEFGRITKQACTYCKKPPAQKSRSYVYNGIDRVDPKQGYLLDNSVAACGECNFIKGNRLSFGEMKAVGEALAAFRRGVKKQG
jgi:5-methylcytosine-specific restriction endonuclease McrA